MIKRKKNKTDILTADLRNILNERGVLKGKISDYSLQEILDLAEKTAGLPPPMKGMPFSSRKGRLRRVYKYLSGCESQSQEIVAKPEVKEEKLDSTKLKQFYQTYEWRQLRYIVIKKNKGRCMACNRSDLPLHVDHIKPLRFSWSLRLDITNLQVLCEECNHGKGNWDNTDWRDKINISVDLVEYFSQWMFWDDLNFDLQKELLSGIIQLVGPKSVDVVCMATGGIQNEHRNRF